MSPDRPQGVGLIRILRPQDDEAFETILDPVRKPTPHAAVDGFLEQRLTEGELQTSRSAIEGSQARVLPFSFTKRISWQFVIYG
jgi:hypothetical protein